MAARTYDLAVFAQPERPGGESPATLGVPAGAVLTGVAKLAQAFLIELLTERGSLLLQPERGTTLLQELRTGAIQTVTDVHQAFAFATGAAARQLRLRERPEDPDDERFADAQLQGVTLLDGGPRLEIALSSLAGSTRTLILPLPSLPR